MKINTIYNERAEETLIKIPADVIDLTVTSPPYDKLRSYNNVFDLSIIARELLRATKEGGVCVWVVSDQTKKYSEYGTSFRQALEFMANGWNLYDTMIWKKANYMPGTQHRYADEFEYMFVFSKGKPKTFNPIKIKCVTAGVSQKWAERPHESKVYKKNGIEYRKTLETKIKGNVWEYSTGVGGSTKDMIAFEHPAIFPEKLVADHIHSWTNEGDLVYDPFAGSGTTPKMAILLNRRFLASEIDPQFVDLSKRRIEPYIMQQQLFKQPSPSQA